jgi:MSHA pilin protein MshA
MNKNSGFTLIELVVVIVILGILAAVALPRFFSVEADARTAALQGFAGSLASASAMNYGRRLARGPGQATILTACDAANMNSLLNAGTPLAAGVTVGGAWGAPANGGTVTCTLTDTNITPNVTVNATIIAVID